MCCLFGLIDYTHRLSGRQKTRIVSVLATESEACGTDAAGLAYNSGGKLQIYKRPGSAHKLSIFLPQNAYSIIGHTRLATQGKAERNRNNHPFSGRAGGMRFALAHNGVLYNDKALYFVKGDNPLCLLHFPWLGLYLYASTEEILKSAVARTWLKFEPSVKVPVVEGDILTIDRLGHIQTDHFEVGEPWSAPWERRWLSTHSSLPACGAERWYIQQLKSVASAFGYCPEQIDTLLRQGWSTDEIEDAIYCCEEL